MPLAKVAVTDACIFIDLMELKIISNFFDLDLEIHTTVDVLMELYPEQREILKAYQTGDKLTIHNLNDDQIKEIKALPFPKGLSPEDRSVLFIASKLKDALVLSSDGLVRNFAGELSVEYHGIFWIFDQLVHQDIMSKKTGVSKLRELLEMNIMYRHSKTKKEAEKRIKEWGK